MKIAEALVQIQSSQPKMKLRDALMQSNPAYARAKKAEEARINSEKALEESRKYAESAKFWETISYPSGALKSVGTELIGTSKAVGADLVNVLTPWNKNKIQDVQFGGKTFQTPSAKGAEAGTLAKQGEYKKASGKMGEAVLDVASVVSPASITIKALKAGSILRAAIGAGLATAPIGAGYGATGAMQEGAGTGDILKQSLKGGAIAFGAGATLGSIPGITKTLYKIVPKIEEVIGKLTSKETKILETELTSGKTPEQAVDTVLQSRPIETNTQTAPLLNDQQKGEAIQQWMSNNKKFSDTQINEFKSNPVGVNELDFDKNGNITLYRKGDVKPGEPQSYSLVQKSGQEPVVVNKKDILVNFNSEEITRLVKQASTDPVQHSANMNALPKFQSLETEVIAITKKDGIPSGNTVIDTAVKSQPSPDVTPKKESGYAKSLEEKAVEKKMASEFQDLAEYTPAVRKEQAQMTTKLINEDIEKVNSILEGKSELPNGMRGSSLALAVEQHAIANNDVKLLQKLAKSKISTGISEAGSELSMLAGRNANSPVRIIRNIIKARKENVVKRLKGKKVSEARKVTKESIKKAIKKEAPTKETWSNFIKEIKC